MLTVRPFLVSYFSRVSALSVPTRLNIFSHDEFKRDCQKNVDNGDEIEERTGYATFQHGSRLIRTGASVILLHSGVPNLKLDK